MFERGYKEVLLFVNRKRLAVIVRLLERYLVTYDAVSANSDVSIWQGTENADKVTIDQSLRILKRRLGK